MDGSVVNITMENTRPDIEEVLNKANLVTQINCAIEISID